MNITVEDAAKAFTEWERRYREDPNDADRFHETLKDQPEQEYGAACAAYFAYLLSDLDLIQEETP